MNFKRLLLYFLYIKSRQEKGHIALRVSGAGGFHLYALQDPYVTVSRHTAPTVQPMAESQIPKTQVVWVHGLQCDLTSGSP
jgi:hypothetical protein